MLEKLKTLKEIQEIAEHLKKNNKTVAFTNGCFDILHMGHISYLQKARAICDILIVGLNSDASVKRIKGKNRPINSQHDRAFVLCGLESVDYVVLFEEDTPINLIKAVKPDILIKGADWKEKEVAGCDFVKSYGGACRFIEFVNNRSTTNIIKKIVDEYCKDI